MQQFFLLVFIIKCPYGIYLFKLPHGWARRPGWIVGPNYDAVILKQIFLTGVGGIEPQWEGKRIEVQL